MTLQPEQGRLPGQVRFGIVGPGKVAELHAAALARIPSARLVGVVGRNADRTRALARRHGAAPWPSLEGMLDSGRIDALIVCTPHPLHAEQAIAAARAGVNVVVEKPMALTTRDCDAMIAAAVKNGVLLSVVSQRRWYPAVQRVKAAIDEDRIGGPGLATVEVLGWRGPEYYALDPWRGTPEGEGGGVLVNQAVHQLDLLRWFLGPLEEVDGRIANLNHPQILVEDSAVGVVTFASGALATIVASNSQRPGLHANIHVHGRNGASVGVETDRGSSFVAGMSLPSLPRNDLWTIPGEEALPERWAAEDEAALAGVDIASHHHELQLLDVVEAIRERRPAAVDGFDGRATVELIASIYESNARGGPVRLGLPRR
ncbi:MAG TPA: Gfo/Idh/MocA family oxidoreductase [Candidatus Limnocylindrales bacterium]|nr:Gfo/Idh/MocA family oxidoreductase [Candidatus Limnocylindrales bacterium]